MPHLIAGCGYLGRRVARLWLERGHAVYALTRSDGSRLPPGVNPIRGDVTDKSSLIGLQSRNWDAVLYAVGMDRSAGKGFAEVYVGGLQNVLEALPAGGRFVYISSTSVYGQTDGSWVDEDSPTEPGEESGRVILEAERSLHRLRPDAVILRFAGIYGPGRLLRRQALERGEPLVGDADKWLNLIAVDDGAAAVEAAVQRGEPGRTYLIADGAPVRRRDFYTRLAEVLVTPPARFEAAPPGATAAKREAGNRRVRSDRAKAELEWTPRWPDYAIGLPEAAKIDAEGAVEEIKIRPAP